MNEFSHSDKELYYFDTKGIPLHNYSDIIGPNNKVIIVDSWPKLQFN
jgi:hypothetical protein